jgi:hypothetical protein
MTNGFNGASAAASIKTLEVYGTRGARCYEYMEQYQEASHFYGARSARGSTVMDPEEQEYQDL